MVSLKPATMSDIEGLEMMPVDTEWYLNQPIFEECVRLGCIPMTNVHMKGDVYFFVHHEQVARYKSDPWDTTLERQNIVREWLHEHHRLVRSFK